MDKQCSLFPKNVWNILFPTNILAVDIALSFLTFLFTLHHPFILQSRQAHVKHARQSVLFPWQPTLWKWHPSPYPLTDALGMLFLLFLLTPLLLLPPTIHNSILFSGTHWTMNSLYHAPKMCTWNIHKLFPCIRHILSMPTVMPIVLRSVHKMVCFKIYISSEAN